MSQSPFAKSLFISACVTGVIFSAAAAPFALLKSNTVGLSLQNREIYSSELKYLAAPYLAVAGSVSVAMGLGMFGLVGWRQSARKVALAESMRQDAIRDLAVYQAELERIKFSEARLRSQQLTDFLQPEPRLSPVAPVSSFPEAHPVAGTADDAFDIALSAVRPEQVAASRTAAPAAETKERAQSAPGSTQGHPTVKPLTEPEPLDLLVQQLQLISKQVEELRGQNGNQMAA